ncbi:MAG: 50S ribosomal protein L30e [Promethearchaeota archaeon]|jgi:large subunit ribosomal protein L30e
MAKRRSQSALEKVDLSRKKTKEFDVNSNIRVAFKTGKFVYGKNQVLRHLREDSFKMIITSNNCPDELMAQLIYYNSLLKDKVYIHRYMGSSWDLGLTCAKPYMISVIGVVNEGDSDLLSLRTKQV